METAVEQCVFRLTSNPKFKPRVKGQSKEEAAFAVCSSALKQNSKEPYLASKHDSAIALAEEIAENGSLRFDTPDRKPIEVSEGKLPKKIELFRAGVYKHPLYGDLEFNKKRLEDFVTSFEARLEAKGPNREENLLPINAGHDKSGPAYGWIHKLSTDGETLFAHVREWTKLGKEAIEENLYRYVSAEFFMEGWSDFQTAEEEENVVTGAALTNIPYMQVLMPVRLTLDKKSAKVQDNSSNLMKLSKIVVKDPKDLSKEEIAFLKEKAGKLSDADKEKFASILVEKKEKKTVKKETEKKEGVVTLEKEKFEEMKATLDKYERDEKKREVEKFVDGLIHTESNKEGKFLKKQRDTLVEFVASMSDEQKTQFEKFVESMPEINLFEEKGEGDGSEIKAKFDALVEAYKAKHPKASTRDAIKKVFEKNPSLREEYKENALDKAETN